MAITVERINTATEHAADALWQAMGAMAFVADKEKTGLTSEDWLEIATAYNEGHLRSLAKYDEDLPILRFIEVALVGSSAEQAMEQYGPAFRQLSAHRASLTVFDEAHRMMRELVHYLENSCFDPREWAVEARARLDEVEDALLYLLQVENRITIRYLLDNPNAATAFAMKENPENTNSPPRLPQNPDVLELCKELRHWRPDGPRSQKQIAVELLGPADNLDSLLRQAREFRHLWDPAARGEVRSPRG